MTEETETGERNSESDDRFEVKWRKKNDQATSVAEPESAPVAADDVATLQRELAEERQRVKDLQERWHRAAADLANLRKRTEQERGDTEQFANMRLIFDILPVLDNFQRAIDSIPGNLAMLTWIHGIVLMQRHLNAILEQQGLAPIEAHGTPFNPQLHEAIAETENAEQPAGTIVSEYQKGYTMHGRVIRPSLVEIAKEPSIPEAPSDAEAAPQSAETNEDQAHEIADDSDRENVGP